MTAITQPRLIDRMVPSFNRDGTVDDLAHPSPASVCFLELAGTLSRIARFNGIPGGLAYSVGQHSVMGAQALINEGCSKTEAALFLLHDGHEWRLGDITRPFEDLLAGLLPSLAVKEAIRCAKAAWDEAIYVAAGLAPPSEWTPRQKKIVKSMDDRMCAAEAAALLGERAKRQFPRFVTPKTTGNIRPWSAGIAEEKFITMLSDMIGPERIAHQSAVAANARLS
jgi:5'-deoxynucleotidase YfbR-like HD superfamily hydrolase